METASGYLDVKFSIGGYGGNHTELRTFQNQLYYYRGLFGNRWEPITAYGTLIEVDRTALHNALIPCLEWESRYDSDILDGTQWTLSIQLNGQSRDIYGSNNYPENFNPVIHAVEQVIQKPLL